MGLPCFSAYIIADIIFSLVAVRAIIHYLDVVWLWYMNDKNSLKILLHNYVL